MKLQNHLILLVVSQSAESNPNQTPTHLVHLLHSVVVVLDGGGDLVGGILGVVEAEGLGVADGALGRAVGNGLRECRGRSHNFSLPSLHAMTNLFAES